MPSAADSAAGSAAFLAFGCRTFFSLAGLTSAGLVSVPSAADSAADSAAESAADSAAVSAFFLPFGCRCFFSLGASRRSCIVLICAFISVTSRDISSYFWARPVSASEGMDIVSERKEREKYGNKKEVLFANGTNMDFMFRNSSIFSEIWLNCGEIYIEIREGQ